MATPLFSIITITYNAAKELPATLESVASQSFVDYEHLIIDGVSTDDTLRLASECGNPRLSVYSEPDKGLYDAMNKGIGRAKGEYLIFLNAGDAFTTDDTLAAYAAASGDGVDIIYGDTRLVNSSRKVVGARHLSVPRRLTFRSFARGMLVCHQAFCVRRVLAPTYDLQYRFSADYEWCLRCLKNTVPERCVNLNGVVIDYLTDGLTDHNKRASLKERFKIMCRYYGTLPTIMRHTSFLARALWRKASRKRS